MALPPDLDLAQSVQPAGKFRLYLGSVAGVGKTFAMLDEANRRAARGTDVVIGLVETHGRPRTMELCRGLEVVPRKQVHYRGASFSEMDLDAILVRAPEVVLVDELAHTNVPGSGRHEKRWQDVIELLDAGIAVISTVNIQHVESIADAVEAMTGAKVQERVPDWVLRRADQLELIDSSPKQLRRRMLHGNIYPQAKVASALSGFFQTQNLTALRELALRFVADDAEEELLGYLQRHASTEIWETTERVLAVVGATPEAEAVIHRAARISTRLKASLEVALVAGAERTPKVAARLADLAEVSTAVDAVSYEVLADDPVAAVLELAERQHITQLVVSAPRDGRFSGRLRTNPLVKLLPRAAEAGIDVHLIAHRDPATSGEAPR